MDGGPREKAQMATFKAIVKESKSLNRRAGSNCSLGIPIATANQDPLLPTNVSGPAHHNTSSDAHLESMWKSVVGIHGVGYDDLAEVHNSDLESGSHGQYPDPGLVDVDEAYLSENHDFMQTCQQGFTVTEISPRTLQRSDSVQNSLFESLTLFHEDAFENHSFLQNDPPATSLGLSSPDDGHLDVRSGSIACPMEVSHVEPLVIGLRSEEYYTRVILPSLFIFLPEDILQNKGRQMLQTCRR